MEVAGDDMPGLESDVEASGETLAFAALRPAYCCACLLHLPQNASRAHAEAGNLPALPPAKQGVCQCAACSSHVSCKPHPPAHFSHPCLTSAAESDGEPAFGRQQRAQQQRAQPQQRTQQQQRAPSKTAPAAAAAAPAGKKAAAKPKPKPKEPQAQFQTEPPPLPEGLVSTLISSSSYVVPMDPMAPAGKKAAKPKPKPKKVVSWFICGRLGCRGGLFAG